MKSLQLFLDIMAIRQYSQLEVVNLLCELKMRRKGVATKQNVILQSAKITATPYYNCDNRQIDKTI